MAGDGSTGAAEPRSPRYGSKSGSIPNFPSPSAVTQRHFRVRMVYIGQLSSSEATVKLEDAPKMHSWSLMILSSSTMSNTLFRECHNCHFGWNSDHDTFAGKPCRVEHHERIQRSLTLVEIERVWRKRSVKASVETFWRHYSISRGVEMKVSSRNWKSWFSSFQCKNLEKDKVLYARVSALTNKTSALPDCQGTTYQFQDFENSGGAAHIRVPLIDPRLFLAGKCVMVGTEQAAKSTYCM